MSTKERNKREDSREPFDVYIVGLGIMGVRHVTREAEDCLKASKHVLYVDHGFGVPEYLESLCPKTTNLLAHYAEGKDRLRTYKAMAAAVIDAAYQESPVCFATYGHPGMFVYPTILIRKAATLLGLRMHVVPGISTFDTVLLDLGVDPGLAGLQMYEATALLVDRRELQPDVPCLLLQVDTVESALFTRAPSRPERFRRLQEHLLRFYPPSHLVISVFSPPLPILEPIRHEFPLAELSRRYLQRSYSGTLYIPPIPTHRNRDEELARDVYNPAHLAKIIAAQRR